VADEEMFRTFNMGLGMVLAVRREKAAAVQKSLADCHFVGYIDKGRRRVRLT
jgi:phosphoribosylaminoimidazole (AIR) synthetase